jgi:hypothetical protein
MTTSKIPTVDNWSRDTTVRLSGTLWLLARDKPEEFEILVNLTLRNILGDKRNSKAIIARLWAEKLEQSNKIEALEAKLAKLEEQNERADVSNLE